MSNSANTKRIAKNTGLLYIRTLLTMFVSLYTSRVVLNTLGVEDFGIYNVVGGIVVMFSFLNSAMSSATQRYFSFELGQGNTDQLKKLFSITVNIHFLIAIVITILAETVGLWFLNTKLNIPADKMYEANWVFQFSIATFFLTVISVPYNAAIISHERMGVYAYVSIFEVLAKLGVVYILVLTQSERLIWYAGMLFSVALFVRIFYGFYCKRNFEECTYQWIKDKKKSIELMHYAGWNLFGNLAAVGFTQGLNMLLNIYFGPSLNTSYSIGLQINGAILMLFSNIMIALNPQILKSYSTNKVIFRDLITLGMKYSALLFFIPIVIIIFQIDYLLDLWLGFVPMNASQISIFFLIASFLNSLTDTLNTAIYATAKIKVFQFFSGMVYLIVILMISLLFLFGFEYIYAFILNIICVLLLCLFKLYYVQKLQLINVFLYVKVLLFNVCPCIVLILFSAYIICEVFQYNSLVYLITRSFLILISALFINFQFALTSSEKQIVLARLKLLLAKLKLLLV